MPRLLWLLLRNRVRFLPKARAARRAVESLLIQNGHSANHLWLELGPLDADELVLVVVFADDTQLQRFLSSGLAMSVTSTYRRELLSRRYPPEAAERVQVCFDSDEHIDRVGMLGWLHGA